MNQFNSSRAVSYFSHCWRLSFNTIMFLLCMQRFPPMRSISSPTGMHSTIYSGDQLSGVLTHDSPPVIASSMSGTLTQTPPPPGHTLMKSTSGGGGCIHCLGPDVNLIQYNQWVVSKLIPGSVFKHLLLPNSLVKSFMHIIVITPCTYL